MLVQSYRCNSPTKLLNSCWWRASVIPVGFAIAVTILSSVLPAIAQSEKAVALCDSGAKADDQPAVIAACTQVIKSGPKELRENALYNRAQTYRRLKKWDEAVADYSAAIVLKPKDLDAFLNRAEVFMLKGSFADAVGDLTTCIKGTEQTFYPQLRRGVAYLGSGDFKSAISDFDAALKFNSDNAAKFKTPEIKLGNDSYPLYGRGLAEIKSGNAVAGKADIQKAETLKPDVADFFARYGFGKPAT